MIAASARLVEREEAVDLALVLDEAERRELVGPETRLTRLRYKPGTSIVAAFTSDAPGCTHGWIACYADPQKTTKALERAERSGFEARAVPGLPGVVLGEAFADRTLARSFSRLRRTSPATLAGAAILRHNPHRRIVLRADHAGDRVALKVAAAPHDDATLSRRSFAFSALRGAGYATLEPAPVHGVRAAETVRWWGEGDLGQLPRAGAARLAGAQLAALHAAPVNESGQRRGHGGGGSAALAVARTIAVLRPASAAAAARVLLRSHEAATRAGDTDRGPALVHGDFSPDQVLVGADGVRLIDLDRAGVDAPEADLATFAATSTPALFEALLDGYTTAGGDPDERRLRALTARALLVRSLEPFRSGSTDWAEALDRSLALAEEVLAS